MKSWKIGAVSGLLAGIILGILVTFFARLLSSMGLLGPPWPDIIPYCIEINILLGVFWGIILGIIFSKVYGLIPGKGILKGLYFGLIFFVIYSMRMHSFFLAYGTFVLGDLIHEFAWPISLTILGILYHYLQIKYRLAEEPKIKTYNISTIILPGAIAGFMGGLAASVFAVIGHVTGQWGIEVGGQLISTIDFWMSQAGAHIFINMSWNIVFAMIFVKVYNLIPGKGAIKGLYFGLIMYFIITFAITVWGVAWLVYGNYWSSAIHAMVSTLTTALAQFIVFSLVLGYLYKPPK
jgi:hypothetical protein